MDVNVGERTTKNQGHPGVLMHRARSCDMDTRRGVNLAQIWVWRFANLIAVPQFVFTGDSHHLGPMTLHMPHA
jgi:hypothetical protein